ncbi:MAG TPA: hypothetical protein VHG93_05515 [Longimicrobium sp.]|nr:hypothetical protein [Longimicrobium sp.]
MTRSRMDLLASPLLAGALVVLVVNDHVLKPAFHNAVTGKLSDVAGVAAFALFWAALLPRHRRAAFVATAAGFAAWKSPASQPLIDAWNSLGWMTMGRVVDWTDLLALAVLPIIYRYDPRPVSLPRPRRVMGPAVAAGCVMAFAATSRAYQVSYPLQAAYVFELSPDSLLERMYDLRVGFNPSDVPPAGVRTDRIDTIFLTVGVRGEDGELYPVTVRAELASAAAGGSVLRPFEAEALNANFNPAAALRSLEQQVVEPLRRNRPNPIRLEPRVIGNRQEIEPRILAPGELFASRAEVRVAIAEASFVALVEVTPRLDWHLIYPVTEDDERLLPAGEHTLATLCARAAPAEPVPPGEEVPPCALARRMTMDDARRLDGQQVPDPCPREVAYPIRRVRPGTLLLIAADGPLPRAELEETLGSWCRGYPGLAELDLAHTLRRMGVKHWAAVDADLRR